MMFWNAEKYFDRHVVPVVTEMYERTNNKGCALTSGRVFVMKSKLSKPRKNQLLQLIDQEAEKWV